ncbi:YlbF family regulator [Shimazuella sp. AN120528]|uniref:YlbF family regulator n=1 Tax=Shimazuella soli TaxID=1892854 RepID=UPI001F0DC8A4|nr:YlbF family regulator [Shimazuella soli]MCH5583605.1 YlbF family regulator [Shimazuella soli]
MMSTFDLNELMEAAEQLGNQINDSNEVKRYLELKKEIHTNAEAQMLIKSFEKVKEDFEETKRFGIFHPNYHEAKEKMEYYQEKLNDHPLIGEYFKTEQQIEQLLFQVSHLIARSVSKEIKVPNDLITRKKR